MSERSTSELRPAPLTYKELHLRYFCFLFIARVLFCAIMYITTRLQVEWYMYSRRK